MTMWANKIVVVESGPLSQYYDRTFELIRAALGNESGSCRFRSLHMHSYCVLPSCVWVAFQWKRKSSPRSLATILSKSKVFSIYNQHIAYWLLVWFGGTIEGADNYEKRTPWTCGSTIRRYYFWKALFWCSLLLDISMRVFNTSCVTCTVEDFSALLSDAGGTCGPIVSFTVKSYLHPNRAL